MKMDVAIGSYLRLFTDEGKTWTWMNLEMPVHLFFKNLLCFRQKVYMKNKESTLIALVILKFPRPDACI